MPINLCCLTFMFVSIFSSTALAAENLEEKKLRLLDRIIETEDTELRARLVSIYESLGQTTAIKPEKKSETPIQLSCILSPKVIETTIVRPSNDFERGRAKVTGETARVVTNDRSWPAYLTPSGTKDGCKANFDGKNYKVLDCRVSNSQYWFQVREGFTKSTLTVDRRTGDYSSQKSRGKCTPMEEVILM